jgi:hypothetical protein
LLQGQRVRNVALMSALPGNAASRPSTLERRGDVFFRPIPEVGLNACLDGSKLGTEVRLIELAGKKPVNGLANDIRHRAVSGGGKEP